MFNPDKFLSHCGSLLFDVVNTIVIRNGKETDMIKEPSDILSWGISVGLLANSAAIRLSKVAGEDNPAFVKEFRRFRNRLRSMVGRLAEGKPLDKAVISDINKHLKIPYGYERIVVLEGKAVRKFVTQFSEPSQLLTPIAEEASRFVIDGEPSKIKQCESGSCVLYFYDTSKNQSRRWCSMSSCGNREKANAYYRRRKQRNK